MLPPGFVQRDYAEGLRGSFLEPTAEPIFCGSSALKRSASSRVLRHQRSCLCSLQRETSRSSASMVERVNDVYMQDVKQRALRITWKTERPTDEELLDAFRPLGDVVRVQVMVSLSMYCTAADYFTNCPCRKLVLSCRGL